MTRKALRNIIVDGKSYKWLAGKYNCDVSGGYVIRIWDENKNPIYEELATERITTPKNIRNVIIKFNGG